MDLRNSNGSELRNFYFTTVWKLFSKIFIRSGRMCIVWNSIQVLPNQVSKNPSICLKILTYKSSMESFMKKRVKLWEQIEFNG